MNTRDIARVAHAAGFRGRALETAVAVALAESGGDPRINARGAEDSRGLWQINSVHFGRYDDQRLYEPGYNARAAFAISDRGRNWHPWTTWNEGRHQPHLDDARRAVRAQPWRDGRGERNHAHDNGRRHRADREARRRAGLAPWRVPRAGAGSTGRVVVTPSFLDDLARTLTGHLAIADEVDRGARHRVVELDIDELVVADGLGGFVARAAHAALDDHDGTRRLPGLLTCDVGYVVEARRRAIDMDAAKAVGPKAVDVLVASLGKTTSRRTRTRVRGLLHRLGPDRLPTTPRKGDRQRTAGRRPAAVRLDRRWGGGQAVCEQLVTPFMQKRGLQPGSAKRGVIPGSSTASDHYVGNTEAYAVDYPTTQGADDARALAGHLGIDGWRPDSFQRFHVRVGGARFRVQILWGAAIDHADHVHVGIRTA